MHELAQKLRGELRTDGIAQAMYATDASIYQIPALGVVFPRDEGDVQTTLGYVRDHHLSIIARGAATSLAGQTVGQGLQLDFTRSMQRMLELNHEQRWAWVEPGIVLDRLNGLLAPQGLHFAPDVSTSSRASLGGMIANNSSGMYSLVYGKTIDHVLELRVMLSDGSIIELAPLSEAALHAKLQLDSLEGRVYRTVHRLGRELADEVVVRYPKVLRRVSGYNLDCFVPGAQPNGFNLSPMIVGSEGTLAIILAAKVRLTPRPAHAAIVTLEFASLDDALDAVLPCLEVKPAAVELMDDILLGLARRSHSYGHYLDLFLQGQPAAMLQVEFFSDSSEALEERIAALESHISRTCRATAITPARSPAQRNAILQVRKAGMPLLQSISPDRKPETFVEDAAVPPERLASYIRAFREICRAHKLDVAFYGHASVGVMHPRPLLNLKNPEDVKTMRAVAEEVRDLVIEHGGALSGEHGDGILRSEFNRAMFGDRLMAAFGEIKRSFDPHGYLNPGKIIDAPPMDSHLRYKDRRPITLHTYFRFADTNGILAATELCNGNGLCRKGSGGTMCPSYMLTADEQHSTRGRANALRMLLTGAVPPNQLTGPAMKAALDLCVECKGCTGECPTGVNMTRLKSEWLAHYYADHGTPLRSRLFGHVRQIAEIGSALAPFSNIMLALPGVGHVAEKLLRISHTRRFPAFASEPFHRWFEKQESGNTRPVSRQAGLQYGRTSQPHRATVVLFPDTFCDYHDPHIGRAAVRVLEAAGYRVILPQKRVCCGRPLISKGLLPEVKQLAQHQLDALMPYVEAGLPIIGLEPSCILSFRDEYKDLLDDRRTEKLAASSFLIDEFLARAQHHLPFAESATPHPILLHGHCHQKALIGTSAARQLLSSIPGAQLHEVDSGCCGMAGSFGYEAEHVAISQRMAERMLLPAIRALPANAEIVAMGTSCRQQISDLSGRHAQHLVEVLAAHLEYSNPT